jgi:hypothetical protein
MKYGIDYRLLAKDGKSLVDNTTMHRAVDVEVDEEQFALIPNVGDFVDIPGDDPGMRNVPLKGRVRSRLFKYVMNYCYITIIVEDTDEDWKKLRAKAMDT